MRTKVFPRGVQRPCVWLNEPDFRPVFGPVGRGALLAQQRGETLEILSKASEGSVVKLVFRLGLALTFLVSTQFTYGMASLSVRSETAQAPTDVPESVTMLGLGLGMLILARQARRLWTKEQSEL
jgi:hypothetical protein